MRDALEPSVAGVIATLALLGLLGLVLCALLFVYDVVLWFVWLRSIAESNRKLDERGRRLQRAPEEHLEFINVSNEPRMIMHNVDGYTLKDKDAS